MTASTWSAAFRPDTGAEGAGGVDGAGSDGAGGADGAVAGGAGAGEAGSCWVRSVGGGWAAAWTHNRTQGFFLHFRLL